MPSEATGHPPKKASSGPRHWPRRLLMLLALAGLVAGITWAWAPRPVTVDAALAVRDRFSVWIREDGRARVKERYTVAAPLSGTLVRIDWEPGDVIEAGDVIARLLPPDATLLDPRTRAEAEARLLTAEAREKQLKTAVGRAQAARDGAQKDATRAKALAAESIISDAELDRLQLLAQLALEDVAAAKLAHQVAVSEVHAARATLGQVRRGETEAIAIQAPAKGRVLVVHRESGGPVAVGTPLLDFGDPNALEVVIDVLSSDAARIRPGAPVHLEQWGDATQFEGHVRLVEPAAFTHISALGVEEQRVNVIVSLPQAVPNLGDGYRVEAEILASQEDDVLHIPSSAVFRHGDSWGTYVIENGAARLRLLELGLQNALAVEVKSGLEAGELVILYPGRRVTADTSVIARQ